MVRSKKWKIILFFLAGITIGIWGFIEIMDLPMGKKGGDYLILFDRVTGLTPSDPVTVNGINVGRVRSIDFHGDSVGVQVWISDNVVLHADACARIKPLGMIGEKFIDLDIGTAETLFSSEGIIPGIYSSDLTDNGENLEEILQTFSRVLHTLNAAIDTVQLKRIQHSTARAAMDLEMLIVQGKQVLSRVDMLLKAGVQLTQTHQTAMDSAMTAIETGAVQIPRITAKVDSVLTDLQVITQDLRNGQGTAGQLLTEDSLYVAATRTLSRIDSLLADVRAHPKKYIKASLIDF